MMIIFFNLVRKRHAEEAAIVTGIILPFQLEYTDDDFCGRRIQDIIIRLVTKFRLNYDLSQYIIYLLSRDHFRGDLSGFQKFELQIRTDYDIQILKTPISGQ